MGWDVLADNFSFTSHPAILPSHLCSQALHESSQVRVFRAGLLNLASEGFLDIFKTLGLPKCLIAQNYWDIFLGMAKAHVDFEAMELLETRRFHSKSFLIWNWETNGTCCLFGNVASEQLYTCFSFQQVHCSFLVDLPERCMSVTGI